MQNPYIFDEVKNNEIAIISDWKLREINNQKANQNYYYIQNFFSKDEVIDINFLLETLEPLKNDGTTGTITGNFVKNDNYRKSKIIWIPKNKQTLWLYDKLGSTALEINKEMNWDFDITGLCECIQYAEYDSEYKGFYDWHMDIGNNVTSKRKISISIQFSEPEEYEGGGLDFQVGRDIWTAPKINNCAIIFPSYFLHRVKPVTKGKRKSLVLWVSGPKFK
jgi:PKHD-type hydroxylase